MKVISAQIFGHPGEIEKFEFIPKYRKTNTYLCKLRDGSQVILKYAPAEERENQETANQLNLNAPRIIGNPFLINEEDEKGERSEKVWFAQEFIQNSKTLNELMGEEDQNDLVLKSFDNAAQLLAKIHGSLEMFLEQRDLPRYSQEIVISELKERMQRLTGALEKYDLIRGLNPGTKLWRNTLRKVNTDALVHIFNTGNEVLVRWDYKPDNLLIQNNTEIKVYSIDWRGLHIGGQWVDLGFLLSDLPEDRRFRHLEVYLDARKIDINRKEAVNNLQTAVAAAQLIHASSNAKMILGEEYSDYNFQRLNDHLTRLGQELI